MTSRKLCTFVVANDVYAVDVHQVQEVLRQQEVTPVPLSHPVVAGLINLRGQIVAAIDLRLRLECAHASAAREVMNVVTRCAGGVVSLLVDDIGDVVDVCDEQREAPPASLRGEVSRLVQAVYKLDSHILLLLDLEKTVRLSEVPRVAVG